MIRVLLPAGDIPLKSTVTVRAGEKRYLLGNELKIYVEDLPGQSQTITAKEGAVFLIPIDNPQCSIYAISSKTPLLWHVEEKELKQWLDNQLEGLHQ